MLKKEITDALNEQINKEIYSAFLYMSMSAYTNDLVLKGFANWFMVQYHEEMYHAMKMYEYIQSQGESVVLKTVEAPPATFDSPLDAMEKTLAHEKVVTASINDLMDLAIDHRDHATKIFLEWYVTEQVEESALFCAGTTSTDAASCSAGGACTASASADGACAVSAEGAAASVAAGAPV